MVQCLKRLTTTYNIGFETFTDPSNSVHTECQAESHYIRTEPTAVSIIMNRCSWGHLQIKSCQFICPVLGRTEPCSLIQLCTGSPELVSLRFFSNRVSGYEDNKLHKFLSSLKLDIS